MKHYGAVLSGDNNILDGGDSSILTIGTAASNDDAIVIHNEAPATATANKVIGTDNGLVLVPYNTITYDAANNNAPSHILGADGREVAVSDLVMDFNYNSALTIPIANATADAYVDSALTQTSVADGTQTVTAGGNVIITGDLQVSGTTTTVDSTTVTLADRFLELGTTTTDFMPMDNSGGLLIVDQRASGVNGYGGFRWNGTDSKFEWSSDTTTGADGDWNDFGSIDSVTAGAGICN